MTEAIDFSNAVCPLCGRPGVALLSGARDYHVRGGDSPQFGVAHCKSCDSGFSLPRLDDEALAAYYPESYEAYVPRAGFRAWLQGMKYRQDLRVLRRYLPEPGASIFEIGAGRGEFLAAAAREQYRVAGLEPSAAGRKTAKEHFGIALTEGYGSGVTFDRQYDAVVARHSLEHMNEPGSVVRAVFERGLRPGGVLLLKLPTMDSWERRLFGKYWCGWDLPRHRVHFTPDGIRRLLQSTGFVDVVVKREVVPIDWVSSLVHAGRHGGSKPVAILGRLMERLPAAAQLLLGQGGSVLMSGFGPGRMIVLARRP